MTIYSFYNGVRKHGLVPYIKSQLLLKAIKNTNKPDIFAHSSAFWHKIALKLASDKNIPTEYIPIKYIIISLENGYLDLASKLYGKIGIKTEIQTRTENLLEDLLYASVGNPVKLAQVEEAGHLLKIVVTMNVVKTLLNTVDGEKDAFKLLLEHAEHNLALDHLSQDYKINLIDSFFYSGLSSTNQVKNSLKYSKRIIPIYHQGAHFQEFRSTLIEPKKLKVKYPIDAVLDKHGEVNVWKTMGLDEYSYKSFVKVNSHYDKIESIAILMGMPLDKISYGPGYRAILKYKIQGASLNTTLKEIQSQNLNIPQEIAERIYREDLLDDSIYPLSDDSLNASHVKIFERLTITGENQNLDYV